MPSTATSPQAYMDALPTERQEAVRQLRNAIRQHLPAGFEEVMNYGMIGYVVPHALYPPGYHADPKVPLPFINLASQKAYIALYHMGLTADDELRRWFTAEYPTHSKTKLDMGKSCIRFKKPADIPYDLIGALASKRTPQQWIALYEASVKGQGMGI